jgi:hypothetical protein
MQEEFVLRKDKQALMMARDPNAKHVDGEKMAERMKQKKQAKDGSRG